MVEPRNLAVEFGAGRLFRQGFLHRRDLGLQCGKIDILDGSGGCREDSEIVLRKFGQAAENDKPVADASRYGGHEPGTKHGDNRRVAGKDAEIAFGTGQVHLIDLA